MRNKGAFPRLNFASSATRLTLHEQSPYFVAVDQVFKIFKETDAVSKLRPRASMGSNVCWFVCRSVCRKSQNVEFQVAIYGKYLGEYKDISFASYLHPMCPAES